MQRTQARQHCQRACMQIVMTVPIYSQAPRELPKMGAFWKQRAVAPLRVMVPVAIVSDRDFCQR